MAKDTTRYDLGPAEAELIDLLSGVPKNSFVCSIGRAPVEGWRVRVTNTAIDETHEGTGATFAEAWAAMRDGGPN